MLGNCDVLLVAVEPVLTEEKMEAALIDPYWRDYCAHHYIEYFKCRREHFPWVIACKPEKHVWEQCQIDEYVCLSVCLFVSSKHIHHAERLCSKLGHNGHQF